MKKILCTLIAFCCIILTSMAQFENPVHWDIRLEKGAAGTDTYRLTMHATVDDGWHLYDQDIPDGGPNPTEIVLETLEGVTPVGRPTAAEGKVIRKFEPVFEMELAYYERSVTFVQELQLKDAYTLTGYVRYMACNDEMCMPPLTEEFSFGSADNTPSAAPSSLTATTAPDATPDDAEGPVAGDQATGSVPPTWAPVVEQLAQRNSAGEGMQGGAGDASGAAHAWWYILLAGFLGGLVALVTPCVWPMIPMTVSFFLKRTKDRGKALRDAWTYGISIIVIYVLLGLVVTAAFGASALNSLATNAVFNIVFFLLLVVFALSFFGAFELALPASWTTRLDAKADRATGLVSIFFMAFTLCLVSFSCTAPIVGTLLVEAATSGSWLHPLIGMLGFAVALSLPFTLFALFPSMLKSMPRSGGWLNSVKVVLGFLELALSLKFLSVADLAYGWGLLDRETFLALWIVIFLLLGLYLLGFIRLPHDSIEMTTDTSDGTPAPERRTSVTALMLALVSLSFAVYMLPGLWGAPCKAISAFAPPISTQDFNLYTDGVEAAYDDYDLGLAAARRSGKPVLVDFSGFGCVNCRKMEAAVWTAPEVKRLIEEEYILVTLMVDDKTPLPTPIDVEENGKTIRLRTVGDRWSYLQRSKFGANAQPFYVLIDADGQPLAGSYAYDEDVPAYVRFLETGLENYRK